MIDGDSELFILIIPHPEFAKNKVVYFRVDKYLLAKLSHVSQYRFPTKWWRQYLWWVFVNAKDTASNIHFCLTKIITRPFTMPTVSSRIWTRNHNYLYSLTPQQQMQWEKYGFEHRMPRLLKEYRNTFQSSGFHPCIKSSLNDSCSYEYKVQKLKKTWSMMHLVHGPSV